MVSPVLLLHMDGANNGTSFTDDLGNVVTPYGNAKTSTARYANLTGNACSALFDGSGDYLSIADNAAFAYGSGAFTVEFWYRPAGISGYQTLYTKRLTSTGVAPLTIRLSAVGTLDAQFSLNGSSISSALSNPSLLSVGSWYHIAVCKQGTATYLLVNGAVVASGTQTGTLKLNAYPILIGGDTNLYGVNGNIDEFRLTIGEAKYTGTYTVPTDPFTTGGSPTAFAIASGATTAFAANGDAPTSFSITEQSTASIEAVLINTGTAFLLHMDGANNSTTFIDECKNRVERVGNPVVSTSQGKFSSQSGLFDGSSQVNVYGTHAGFNIEKKRFLLEAWVYPTARNYSTIFNYGPCTLSILSDGHLYGVMHFIGGSNGTVALEYVQPIPLNTWTHVALGIDWFGPTLFVNGVDVATYIDTDGWIEVTNPLDPVVAIGTDFVGYIDEARFSNGVFPYYGEWPRVTLSQQSPFRIPDSSSAAFFIYEGASTGFIAAPNDPGLTQFSWSTSSTVDIKGVGIRAAPRELIIDTGTTTHFDGWLLIGAESYFDIPAGSDFWFKSPGMPILSPAFRIDGRSVVNFAAPPQPSIKPSQFYLASASAFVPRTEVRRGSKTLIWESSTLKWKGRQNIPYVFSIHQKSDVAFKSSAVVASRFSIGTGTALSLAGCLLSRSKFDSPAQSAAEFNSRKLNGGGYDIVSAAVSDFHSDHGYLPPLPVIEAMESIFYRQREAAINVLTHIDSLHVQEPV